MAEFCKIIKTSPFLLSSSMMEIRPSATVSGLKVNMTFKQQSSVVFGIISYIHPLECVVWPTDGEQQTRPHILTGCNKLITYFSTVRKHNKYITLLAYRWY